MDHGTAQDDMTSRFQEFKRRVRDSGGEAIAGLEAIARGLEMTELASQFKEVNKEFQSDTFKLVVVGRQKNGKSTFLNVLLGPTEGGAHHDGSPGGPMPTDELPATATLTRVYHSERPYVRAWNFDGKPTDWTFEMYHRDAVLRETDSQNQEFFKDIREFEVGYPATLCKYATLIDSPGTDEAPRRTAITTEAVRHCDAAIVVYRHSPSPGEAELAWVEQNILRSGVRVFTVVNLFDGRAVDERLRALIWDRLVRGLHDGEPYHAGQDFNAQDIYFVDARKAGQAKVEGDRPSYERSGMVLFERRITDFLLRERDETHVARFIRAAEQHAERVVEQIGQRRAALQADRKRLEDASDDVRRKLDAIHARRDKLPKILDRYRRECARDLSVGFEQMITQLRTELPSLLRDKPIRALEGILAMVVAPFSQKKAAKEASDTCMAIIEERIEDWCNNPPDKPGAQQILGPVVARMIDEIIEEVATITTDFLEVHFMLTGWEPKVPPDAKADVTGRVIGIIGGILLGDVGLMLGGGVGGLRGFAGTLGGYLVGGILASLLGLSITTALPLVLLGGLIGGIGWARHGLENRIWEHTARKADDELRKMLPQSREVIDSETTKTFSKLRDAVMKDVGSIVAQEEENVNKIRLLNQQDQLEKDKALKGLDRAEAQLKERTKQLRNVLVLARQIGGQERAGAQAS